MLKPVTANFKVTTKHQFVEGDYLLKIVGQNRIAHFIVDQVISMEKVNIRAILNDGSFSNVCESISGNELNNYILNRTANSLAKELSCL